MKAGAALFFLTPVLARPSSCPVCDKRSSLTPTSGGRCGVAALLSAAARTTSTASRPVVPLYVRPISSSAPPLPNGVGLSRPPPPPPTPPTLTASQAPSSEPATLLHVLPLRASDDSVFCWIG